MCQWSVEGHVLEAVKMRTQGSGCGERERRGPGGDPGSPVSQEKSFQRTGTACAGTWGPGSRLA